MNSQSKEKTTNEENQTKIIQFKEPLSLKIGDYTIQKLIDSFRNKEDLKDIIIQVSENENILEIDDLFQTCLGIIFVNPIKVKYERAFFENKYCTIIDENVYSNIQINLTLEKYKMLYPNFYDINNKLINYYESIYSLFWNVKNNELNFINSFKECKFIPNDINLMNKTTFNKTDLSKYFDDYFLSVNEDKEFTYYSTPNRKNLKNNFSRLLNNKNISEFKMTGPSGEGKSISLLYLSRCSFNKIYLNLKTIYKLFSSREMEKYLDLLMYEFGRLKFANDDDKIKFEEIFNKYSMNNFWELLEKLSEVLKNYKILFIFDQFKEKYLEKKYFQKIKENLKGNLKIIISSSINDNEIGNAAANSLIKHRNEHFILTEDYQNDYFYYHDLIYVKYLKQLYKKNDNDEKNKIYDYFGWNPKYIYLIDKCKKSKNELKDHIINKMKEHSSNLGYDFELYVFNIYLRVNRETNYDILPLKTLSLKYCKLELGEESFKVYYKYKIVKIIIEELIKNIDVNKYFNNKDYEDNELYSSLKGYFFEYAAIKQLYLLKNSIFEKPINYSLTVENIVKIKQYEGNNELNDTTDNFNMIMEKLDNRINPVKKITKRELFQSNLLTINNELNSRRNEIIEEDINSSEDEYEEENSEENDYIEENDNSYDNEKRNKIINTIVEKKKDINYFFYKNLEKEKSKIENLLGKKIQRTEEKEKNKNITIKKKKNVIKKSNLDKVIEFNDYNEDFKNGGIIISQRQSNGEALDLGVLLGEKDKKQFIGFQMKYYSKKTKLKKEITKDSIKKKIQSILVNCLTNYDIRITEWHYIMCLYYNTDDDFQFSSKLVKNCNYNDLEYIFYNPSKNQFYKSDKTILDKIKLNAKTNIDILSKVNPYLIFENTGFLQHYCNQIYNDNILLSNDENIFNLKSEFLIKFIQNEMKLNIETICKFELDKESHFPIPMNSILLLFGDGNNFIFYYNMNNKLYCNRYLLKKNKFIKIEDSIYPSLIPRYFYENKKFRKNDHIYLYVFKIKR